MMLDYAPEARVQTQFLTSFDAVVIEKEIKEYLESMCAAVTMNNEKFKMKVKYELKETV